VFKNNLENTGELNSLHIYPSNEFALPGAQVTFTAGGADSGKHYVELSEKPVYYAADGMISENIYTTPLLPGKYSVSAGYQNLSTSSEIEVVDSVDRIVPSKKTIYLKPMETIDLTVSAYYENRAVALMDSNFTWECDDIGSIDENGCFTATRALSRTGKITVSYGDTSAEIKVVVLSDLPVKKLPKPFLPLG